MRDLTQQSCAPDLRDFRFVGIIWYVQVEKGWRSEFYRLTDLRRHIAEGRIQPTDQLSYDQEKWTRIDLIPDLNAYFDTIWLHAQVGRLKVRHEIGQNNNFDEYEPTSMMSLAQLGLPAPRKIGAESLLLSPPGVEIMEMPEEDSAVLFEPMSEDSLLVEDEPTMEPPELLRSSSEFLTAPPPLRPFAPAAPTAGAIVRVFLSGIVAGLTAFGFLVWLTGS
ncbi:MAG: hypothetical protein P8R54_18220 [Myxococcota bacterium]|nr:hypothetical protein [Myxococcota bacterium]